MTKHNHFSMKKLLSAFVASFTVLLYIPATVYAQAPTPTPDPGTCFATFDASTGCDVDNSGCSPGYLCPIASDCTADVAPTPCVAPTPTPTPTIPPSTSGTCDVCKAPDTGECETDITNCASGFFCPIVPGTFNCSRYSECPITTPVPCVPPTPTLAPLPTTGLAPTTCSWRNVGGYDISGIDTGLGCIPTDPAGLTLWFLQLFTLTAGGIALLLLLMGGLKFITSTGDPKALDEAKGTITKAISGLLLIIFSVLILRIIGVDILGIPGFSLRGGGGIAVPGT